MLTTDQQGIEYAKDAQCIQWGPGFSQLSYLASDSSTQIFAAQPEWHSFWKYYSVLLSDDRLMKSAILEATDTSLITYTCKQRKNGNMDWYHVDNYSYLTTDLSLDKAVAEAKLQAKTDRELVTVD